MFRYVALIWNTASQQQSDCVQLLTGRLRMLSAQWQEVFDHKGMRVFCADARSDGLEPYLLAKNSGVVLGTLFERSTDAEDPTPARKAVLDSAATECIVRSRGEQLLARYWGDYVALLAGEDERCRLAIKDPTGNIPCFGTQYRGATVLFSCIADCMNLQLPSFTMNPAYLGNRFLDGGCDHVHNPLNDVYQVYRGECVEIDPSRESAPLSRRFLWTPLHFPRSDRLIEDPAVAARAMRATVRYATHSLAGRHKNLLLRLSGGLDSSIINGCLKDAPSRPEVTCYTYFNPRGRSDERPWARLAAQHSGFEHLEQAIGPEDLRLEASLQMPPSVEPAPVLEFLQRTALEAQLARPRGSTAVFTGDGGDSGFCSDSIRYALSEYFRLHGVRPLALRLAPRIALLAELSTWTVLVRSLQQWRTGSTGNAMSKEELLSACKLVNPALVATFKPSQRTAHPWFRSDKRIPGGIVRRVGMLIASPQLYNAATDASQSAPEIVAPLYSQPVVELLLRIPIHVHFEEGRDRGLARRAFAAEVPPSILQRRWKDRAPGFHDELVYRNRDFLREFFLDGVLVGEGLLIRTAIEQALSAAPNKSQVLPAEILSHMDIEIWARHWRSSAKQRAVA